LLHPPGELSFEQVEAAVLNVARYDIPKLLEALWSGQAARTLRMLDGLQAEGESAVFVHWSMAEDLRALARGRAALDSGKPLPMALKDARAWGAKERLFERVLPGLGADTLAGLLDAASLCDGIVKGLKHPRWPLDPWAALRRLVLMSLEAVGPGAPARRGPVGMALQ
jgi:DNA polymerase-3 subunit delta